MRTPDGVSPAPDPEAWLGVIAGVLHGMATVQSEAMPAAAAGAGPTRLEVRAEEAETVTERGAPGRGTRRSAPRLPFGAAVAASATGRWPSPSR